MSMKITIYSNEHCLYNIVLGDKCLSLSLVDAEEAHGWIEADCKAADAYIYNTFETMPKHKYNLVRYVIGSFVFLILLALSPPEKWCIPYYSKQNFTLNTSDNAELIITINREQFDEAPIFTFQCNNCVVKKTDYYSIIDRIELQQEYKGKRFIISVIGITSSVFGVILAAIFLLTDNLMSFAFTLFITGFIALVYIVGLILLRNIFRKYND